jgi:hypothetical protein
VKAAIEGENLGSNPSGAADILAISWTSHDYVNHLFGPESRQSQDQTVRLDRVFAELFDYLDQRIGLQNVLITLSADHGFMNVPEYSASRRLDSGRIDPDKMIEAVNASLSAKFGEGKYITAWWNPNLYVDYKLVEARKLNRVEVENAAQEVLRAYPGVEAVFTRTQLEQGLLPQTKLARQVTLAWHQQISGDIEQAELVSVRQADDLRLDARLAVGLRHQRAARDYGPSWVSAGKYGDSEVVDLARTIAFILNVRPPNGCESASFQGVALMPRADVSDCPQEDSTAPGTLATRGREPGVEMAGFASRGGGLARVGTGVYAGKPRCSSVFCSLPVTTPWSRVVWAKAKFALPISGSATATTRRTFFICSLLFRADAFRGRPSGDRSVSMRRHRAHRFDGVRAVAPDCSPWPGLAVLCGGRLVVPLHVAPATST